MNIYRVELIRGQLVFCSIFVPGCDESDAVMTAIKTYEVLPSEFMVRVNVMNLPETDFMREFL